MTEQSPNPNSMNIFTRKHCVKRKLQSYNRPGNDISPLVVDDTFKNPNLTVRYLVFLRLHHDVVRVDLSLDVSIPFDLRRV
jgi:hypothetical protein